MKTSGSASSSDWLRMSVSFPPPLELDTKRNRTKPKISVSGWPLLWLVQQLFLSAKELEDVVYAIDEEDIRRKSQPGDQFTHF